MAVGTQMNAAHAQLNKKLPMDDFFDHVDLLGKARVSKKPLDRISYIWQGDTSDSGQVKDWKIQFWNLTEEILKNPVALLRGIAENPSVKCYFNSVIIRTLL